MFCYYVKAMVSQFRSYKKNHISLKWVNVMSYKLYLIKVDGSGIQFFEKHEGLKT